MGFYNLREHPFSNVVDNRFYWNSPQHATALVKLKHAIDARRGLAVVIGDTGSGKTTLARKLLEDLPEDKYEAALLVVIHSSVSSEWLLKKCALQLGVQSVMDNKLDVLGQIYRRLYEIYESGKLAVVLMDEVQMLKSREIMEEFRGLLNMELEDGKLLNLVFFGLRELDEVLALDEPLKQRVAVKVNLSSFSENNTREYIAHRLHVGGCDRKIFTDEAVTGIFKYSNGLPRLINAICDNAMLECFLMKKDTVDEETVKTVAITLGLKPENSAGNSKPSQPSGNTGYL